jgi:mRNA-degrading endonuclease RelE of RelBE toxin-antitoxin system
MPFDIVFSPQALDHLAELSVRQRGIVLDAIETQLQHEPTKITRRRKPLRPNPLASWELRVQQFRVYYQVEPADEMSIVYIIAVGRKLRNQISIGGEKVQL